LEEQVMQLKEVYTGSVQEKNAVTNENRRLKALLRMHGIAYQNQEPLSASSGMLTGGYGESGLGTVGASNYTFAELSPPGASISSATSPSNYESTLGLDFSNPNIHHQHMRSRQGSSQMSNISATTQASLQTLNTNQPQYQQQISPNLQHLSPHQHPQQQQHQHQQGGLVLDQEQLGVDFVLASVSQSNSAQPLYSSHHPHHSSSVQGDQAQSQQQQLYPNRYPRRR
jgi:hypothetical protein